MHACSEGYCSCPVCVCVYVYMYVCVSVRSFLPPRASRPRNIEVHTCSRVVSRRRVWLVGEGGIYGCACKEVYRFPRQNGENFYNCDFR